MADDNGCRDDACRACGCGDSAEKAGELVSLIGEPQDVGHRFGEINAADIRRYSAQMTDQWLQRGLTRDDLVAKSAPFIAFCSRFAPHWLDEAAGVARAAGVNLDEFIAFSAGKYRELFFVDECTSFCAVGDAAEGGASLFHKNRDNVSRPQCAYHKHIVHSTHPAAFWATGDTSDTGVMMTVNAHGLAGSADMGGLTEDNPRGRGVMNPYILRLIAEQAECCNDALELVQQMIRDGWYAGGAKTGTHWLFADRYGTALRIEQNAHNEQYWFYKDDIVFTIRGDTAAAEHVTGRRGAVRVRDMNAAATHPDICFKDSISALTVRIDPDLPAHSSSIWFALPAWGPYVPLFPSAAAAPRELVDGSVYRANEPLAQQRTDLESSKMHLPEEIARQREAVQEQIYALADGADRAGAAEVMVRCCKLARCFGEQATQPVTG